MKRGFEHRLWGYKVVKIEQPDAERGSASDSTSSVRSPSPTASLDDRHTEEYGRLGTVEPSRPAQDGEYSDQEPGNVERTIRPVLESRDESEETEEREEEGEWQIPETVILKSESISPF